MNFRNAVGLLVVVATNAFSANLVNGSFEAPVVSSSAQFQTIFPNSEPVGFGWTVVSGTVDAVIRGPTYGASASDGLQWLDLDGINIGWVSQSFSTTTGSTYALQFAYANHPLPGYNSLIPATALVQVRDASTLADLIRPIGISHFSSTVPDLDWTTSAAIAFTASGPTTMLSFRSTNQSISMGGIFLDAVSVSAVPEPSSILLLLLGGSILGLRVVRRKLSGSAP